MAIILRRKHFAAIDHASIKTACDTKETMQEISLAALKQKASRGFFQLCRVTVAIAIEEQLRIEKEGMFEALEKCLGISLIEEQKTFLSVLLEKEGIKLF